MSKPGESNTTIPTLTKPSYRWVVPQSARQFPKDPTSFRVEAWNAGTALDATRVAEKNKTPLWQEMFQRACIEIDDKPADQAADLAVEWGPKCRHLATLAIDIVGIANAQEEKDFLASMIQS
jgi:hypothetical protein